MCRARQKIIGVGDFFMHIIMPLFRLIAADIMLSILSSILNWMIMIHISSGIPLTPQYLVCLSRETVRVGALCGKIEKKLKLEMKNKKNE